MSTEHLIPPDLLEKYHVKEWRNATGILETACPTEWAEVIQVLRDFRLMKSEVMIGGGNRSQWCDKDFDALIKKAAATTDIKERTKLYQQAQAIFHKQDPAVLLAHSIVTMPMAKTVSGYVIDPFGLHHFETVDTSKAGS